MVPNHINGIHRSTTMKRDPGSDEALDPFHPIGETIPVAQPDVMQQYMYPVPSELKKSILTSRQRIVDTLGTNVGDDVNNPLVVIVGPSYISDPCQIKSGAKWLKSIERSSLILALRTNLTQRNQNYGDVDRLNDGSSTMSLEVENLSLCRTLLMELAQICPLVGEISAAITPQYFSDLFSLGIVSSTLVESQLHRELVSGTSFPVGFSTLDSNLPFDEDMYVHKVTAALDSMYASSQGHRFLSVTKAGLVAVVGTVGNEDTFVILQVNQISPTGLKLLIDKVYAYPHTPECPRIMLDVEKLETANYDEKSNTLHQLLQDKSTRNKIVGVMIDSGDEYRDDLDENLVYAENLVKELEILERNRGLQ